MWHPFSPSPTLKQKNPRSQHRRQCWMCIPKQKAVKERTPLLSVQSSENAIERRKSRGALNTSKWAALGTGVRQEQEGAGEGKGGETRRGRHGKSETRKGEVKERGKASQINRKGRERENRGRGGERQGQREGQARFGLEELGTHFQLQHGT